MELRYVTMDELKAQMRVDYADEDDLIGLYGQAAERTVAGMTARTESELLARGYAEAHGEDPGAGEAPGREYFPKPLKVAVLLLAAHLYRNREPVSVVAQNAVPYTVDVLVKPYRRLSARGEVAGQNNL